MARAKLKLVHSQSKAVSHPRLYETHYASGSRAGYCKTLESATTAAIKNLLIHGYSSATISCMISLQDVVRLKMNDSRTRVIVTTVKPWQPTKPEFKGKRSNR